MEYIIALEKFLSEMNQIKDTVSQDTFHALDDLCSVLKISSFTVEYNKHIFQEDENLIVLYKKGECDMKDFFSKVFRNPDESIVTYKIYRNIDSEKWSEEEISRINLFADTVYAYHSRIRLLKIAEEFIYCDKDLNMYNLTYFMKFTGKIIYEEKTEDYFGAYFNLKGFSIVNNHFGREKGTEIMRKYINGISSELSEDEAVCRVGGDNFVALIKKEKLEWFRNYLSGTSISCDMDYRVIISAVAGAYVVENAKIIKRPSDLMDRISTAFNSARRNSHLSFVFFDENMMKYQSYAKWVERRFSSSIEQEEFKVYYQPKISLKDGSVAGAEALCRWIHKGKIIPPDKFIPIIEQGINICTLDFYMLDHVCRDLRRWLDEGKTVVPVSVNVSRLNFYSFDLVIFLLNLIKKYDLEPWMLKLEITESAYTDNMHLLIDTVARFQKEGFKILMDDFGSGYSSLNMLRNMPVDILKLDMRFLEDIQNDPRARAIVKNVVNLARDIDMDVIIEGVETKEQLDFLKSIGCKNIQGFLFSYPMPKEDYLDRFVHKPEKIKA